MNDTKELLERVGERFDFPRDAFDRLERRRDRKRRDQRIRAAVLGISVAVAVGWWGIDALRSRPPVPAVLSEELGIFAPVSGRIVFVNEHEVGDLGYDPGLWAVDPNGPADTTEGPSLADDVASTLVRLDLEDAEPLSWSSDGTELLLMRSDGDGLFPEQYLSILHADGSETRMYPDPMGITSAAISPDGTRVVFAGQYDLSGLYVIDAEGGEPVPLPIPQAQQGADSPIFSPDGSQIAFLVDAHVWVANADGTDAREILADEPTLVGDVGNLQWSPAGDRLAIQVRLRNGDNVISTFAPDGSDFTQVISGALSPHWSPDGSQIAYTIECELSETPCGGLAIADADGSNVRAFGFAASGPWHPGTDVAPPPEGNDVLDRISEGEVVKGWPGTTRNPPGLYSWHPPACVPSADIHCPIGFMHNGYGSGDVDIYLEVVPDAPPSSDDGATAVSVAGHDGIYRMIDALREEWIVVIEGTTIRIRLTARPGASQADLTDAHAIIGSMRGEPQDDSRGFRLVFTLTTNDWDSG